jgi:cytochrome c peroxidase
VWNVFRNDDMPAAQMKIRTTLCDDQQPCPLSDLDLLDSAIARFKTPGLHDLDHSAPYMHNGQFSTLDEIVTFDRDTSTLARAGALRNGAPELRGIALIAGDAASLVAFLRALNEDYQ